MIPGHDLQNIVTLRSINDLQMIQMKSASENIVIVGASFTGLILHLCIAFQSTNAHDSKTFYCWILLQCRDFK